MRNRKKLMLLLLLTTCGLVITASIMLYTNAKSKRSKEVAYTISWKGIFHYPEGREQDFYTEKRFVSANGDWRSVRQYEDGHVRELLADARGVFSIHPEEEKMYFVSGRLRNPLEPEAYQLSSDIREETVLGYLTYVTTQSQGNVVVERYHAPALNGDVIKHIYREGEFIRTLEPIEILRGEPAPESFAHEEYPITSRINKTEDCSQ